MNFGDVLSRVCPTGLTLKQKRQTDTGTGMKKLITVTLALAAAILFTTTAFAGKKDQAPIYDPVYGIEFFITNRTSTTIEVTIESDKGGIYATIAPMSSLYIPLPCDEPLGGFTDNWLAYEGALVEVHVNAEFFVKQVNYYLANLSRIAVTVNEKKGPGLKVGIQLTQ